MILLKLIVISLSGGQNDVGNEDASLLEKRKKA
jgi:hypothetical protein